jgi:CheY-like chemotaxis protein
MAKIADGPPHQAIHILVVEDERSIGQMLADLLADDGYVVDIAANGRLALEKIESHSYDLILSDLRMPELDGVGLYRELERRQPDLLLRLIVITGTSGHPDYERFLAQTQVPVLEKPFSVLALHALMRQVLSVCRPAVEAPRG